LNIDSLEEQIRSILASREELHTEMETIKALIRETELELNRLYALRESRECHSHGALPPLPSCPAQPPLQGFRIGVIGPSNREQAYREVIEGLGARFAFAPSEEKLGQVERLCNKSDGVIFITSYTSHKVEDHLDRAVRRLGLPIYHLRYRGLVRLREAALELQPQMQRYRTGTFQPN
jgi:hypothetical protein